MISNLPVDGTERSYETLAAEAERQEKFNEVLAKLDEALKAMRKSEREKEQERLEAEAKRAKEKKLNKLRQRIQALQTRVNMGQEAAQRELSAIKSELFMLMLFG